MGLAGEKARLGGRLIAAALTLFLACGALRADTDTPTCTESPQDTFTPTATPTCTESTSFTISPTFTPTLACVYTQQLGYSTPATTPVGGTLGYVVMVRVQALTSGWVTAIDLGVGALNGDYAVRAALYSDNAGSPGNLLVESNLDHVTPASLGGFYQVDVPDTYISAGTYYLAFQENDTYHVSCVTGKPGNVWVQPWAFGPFPASIAGPTSIATAFEIQMYADFCGDQIMPSFTPTPIVTATPTVTGTYTITATSTVTVTPTLVPVTGLPFSDDFSTDKGWNYGPEWERGPATASSGQDYGSPDPSQDNTGLGDNMLAGVRIGGNADTTVHGYEYLTSPPINAAGAPALQLSFYRFLNSDIYYWMDNDIEVFDGTQWQQIWTTQYLAVPVEDSSWTNQVFDVTAYANANFQVRFGVQVGDPGVYIYSSWNLDDVWVGVPPTPTPTTTPTATETPTETPTDTPTFTVSSSVTLTLSPAPGSATATLTRMPTKTASPSGTPSLSPSRTNTLVPTVTDTVTRTATRTASSTATPGATGTATATPAVPGTPTFSPSPTATQALLPGNTPTATASVPAGGGTLDKIVILPNPNPACLMLKISGGSTSARLRIYGKSMRMLWDKTFEGLGPGWVRLDLDPAWLKSAANGSYYVAAEGKGGRGLAKGKIVVIK